MGLLLSPDTGWRNPAGLPVHLDNGRFVAWKNSIEWDSGPWLGMLDRMVEERVNLRWIVVPDRVGEAEATVRDWDRWVPSLERYGVPLALAVQDGMTPATVAMLDRPPDLIFVGGSISWKWKTLRSWTSAFSRVHCARVSSERRLWEAHRAGVESSDGTGWQRAGAGSDQARGLERYVHRSSSGLTEYVRHDPFF